MVAMTVTWPASTRTTVVTYQLQYRLAGARIWINATIAPSPSRSAIVTGLTPGALYEFRNVATNGPIWTDTSIPTRLVAGSPPTVPANLKVYA